MMLITVLCCALLSPSTQPTTNHADWKLVWSDEFDHDGAPDPAKWACETGFIRNQEKQFYTVDRRENARVEDGNLIIEARRETFDDPRHPDRHAEYTSASLETRGKAEWKYARVEVRAKIPAGNGMWPAIWMLPNSIRKVGWPACGEIDIMENVGFESGVIHGSVHTKSYNHVIHTEKTSHVRIEKPEETYHVYAIEWDEAKIDFFVDDQKYFTFNDEGEGPDKWPFDQPFFLKLNSAVGGSWGGQKGIDDSVFPQKFYVDYVRVYQRAAPEK